MSGILILQYVRRNSRRETQEISRSLRAFIIVPKALFIIISEINFISWKMILNKPKMFGFTWLTTVMEMRPQEDKRLVLLRKSFVTQQNETRFTTQFIYN